MSNLLTRRDDRAEAAALSAAAAAPELGDDALAHLVVVFARAVIVLVLPAYFAVFVAIAGLFVAPAPGVFLTVMAVFTAVGWHAACRTTIVAEILERIAERRLQRATRVLEEVERRRG